MKPISPDQALKAKQDSIPDWVIKIWNDMLSEKIDSSGSVRITQDEIINAIRKHPNNYYDRSYILELGWLDIEPLYRQAGWDVVYTRADYAGFDSTSYFTFKKAKHKPDPY